MDTDDLTEMAYGIIQIAADRNDFLKSDIGVMASNYRDEDAC
jgi:hypothetical protein